MKVDVLQLFGNINLHKPLSTLSTQNASHQFHLYGRHSFFAFFGLKSDFIAIADFINEARDVDENFLIGAFLYDEAVAFGFVVELDDSFVHGK